MSAMAPDDGEFAMSLLVLNVAQPCVTILLRSAQCPLLDCTNASPKGRNPGKDDARSNGGLVALSHSNRVSGRNW